MRQSLARTQGCAYLSRQQSNSRQEHTQELFGPLTKDRQFITTSNLDLPTTTRHTPDLKMKCKPTERRLRKHVKANDSYSSQGRPCGHHYSRPICRKEGTQDSEGVLWILSQELNCSTVVLTVIDRSSSSNQSTKAPSNTHSLTLWSQALSATPRKSLVAWARSESRSDPKSSHSLR
jgi:hypothetical protein